MLERPSGVLGKLMWHWRKKNRSHSQKSMILKGYMLIFFGMRELAHESIHDHGCSSHVLAPKIPNQDM
jgi:hypothetical protein